jgi:hypothetical protein
MRERKTEMSGTHFLSRAGFVAAALFAMLFSSLPAHATDIPVAGEVGLHSKKVLCPPSSFMAGLQVRSGDWMDQLSIICASVGKDGAVGNHATQPDWYGGSGGALQEPPFNCAPGAVVSGIRVAFTPNNKQVRYFVVNCRAENGGAIVASARIGPAGKDPLDQDCPPGELATGMIVNFGLAVNGVGLICAANPKPVLSVAEQQLQQQCKTYATNAVSAYYQFTGRGCAIDVNDPADKNRWTNNYQGHYAWCIGLGIGSKAPTTEQDQRTIEANNCPKPAHAISTSTSVKFCGADCSVCYSQGLQCSFANSHCMSTAPAGCY